MTSFVQIFLVILIVVNCRMIYATDFGNHNKAFVLSKNISHADWSNPDELARTWDHALVRIPASNKNILSGYMHELDFHAKEKLPTIVYLHGCSGIWKGTHVRLDYLAKAGFAVIAPQSFARNKYPQSCDPVNKLAGIYREILSIRQNDARYALERIKTLSWVDTGNVFLIGLSEGAITAATLELKDMVLSGRVIEGWTCHAGWKEYSGLSASTDEPILSIVGQMDPWYQVADLRGDCGAFMSKNNSSRSVVYREGPLKYKHELMEDADVQKLVLDFLRSHLK